MIFGNIPSPQSDFSTAKALILPIPYEQTSSYVLGSREAPFEILKASYQMELYDSELDMEISDLGIHTLPPVEVDARGPEYMMDRIYKRASEALLHEKLLASLGGEHSISYPIVKAHLDRFPGLTVLQIDAHADLRDSYEETPFSHASVMRRIKPLASIVQVGIRSLSKEEAVHLKEEPNPVFWASDMNCRDFDSSNIVDACGEEVYVTVDMDGFDPSEVPSVGTPEPGGLRWYQVLSLLKQVAERKRIVGFDVVELCPMPGSHSSAFTTAKLVYKMIGYFIVGKKPNK